MKKLALLILLSSFSASVLFAQAAGGSAAFAHYSLSGAGIDYPSGWGVVAYEATGIIAVCLTPGHNPYDPRSATIRQLAGSRFSFAFLLIASPAAARKMGIDPDDLDSFVRKTVENECQNGEAGGLQDGSIGWLPGVQETGWWGGAEPVGTIQMAAARNLQGSVVLFLCISTGPERESQGEAFQRIRQSIAIGGSRMAAGSEGTMRFQNESLAVDYPADWYSAWLEDPYAKTALFTSFDVGDAAAFLTSGGPPVLGAGQTLAAILIDPEEAGPDDVKKQLEDAAASWGPDAKILERGATIIAGMPGTWLSVNAKTASAAGMRVYLAGASGARAGTILFVGLSPADDVAKAQTQFTAILRSIELPRH